MPLFGIDHGIVEIKFSVGNHEAGGQEVRYGAAAEKPAFVQYDVGMFVAYGCKDLLSDSRRVEKIRALRHLGSGFAPKSVDLFWCPVGIEIRVIFLQKVFSRFCVLQNLGPRKHCL